MILACKSHQAEITNPFKLKEIYDLLYRIPIVVQYTFKAMIILWMSIIIDIKQKHKIAYANIIFY